MFSGQYFVLKFNFIEDQLKLLIIIKILSLEIFDLLINNVNLFLYVWFIASTYCFW